jgi:ubiquinone/menaquinone biosynthesis C-methylase UbiE
MKMNQDDLWNTELAKEHYDVKEMGHFEKEIVLRYAKGKCLEIGSAVGNLTNFLKKKGIDIQGIEISEKMVKRAKKKYPGISFRQEDASNLKYPDESFDFIFFNVLDFIHPIEKRRNAISEISRVLKPGGVFLCNLLIPNWYKFLYINGYRKLQGDFAEFKVYRSRISSKIKEFKIYGFKSKGIIYRFRHDTNPFFIFVKESQ